MKTADFPRLLAAFFTDRLMQQLQASPHTIASYRDTFRLLVRHARKVLKKAPTELELGDLDTDFLGAFLTYLEDQRGNDARTRNTRLAAIRSFFGYVARTSPNTRPWRSGSWPCRTSAIPAVRWIFSTGTKSRPCCEPRTCGRGRDAVTAPCCL